MYAAWEKDHRTKIEDYQHTEGQPKVTADSTQWLETVPPILILQLNRTKFNAVGENEKMQHEVPVEKVLNCQRFMLKNRSRVESLRKRLDELR